MTDREKVIKGLECLANNCSVCYSDCPYYKIPSCFRMISADALALLKAQEPREMTLEEIKDGESYWFSAGKEFVPRPVICIHREDDAQKPYITFAEQYGTFSWETEDYGKTWRCWTARPTDEQREAVPWNN